ncbi:MAG: effector binding domain-containing protein [Brevefilum sp.]
MEALNVRIETLPPMRVISAYGFGPQPEDIAARKMEAFLEQKGLLEEYGHTIPHYGFNNPSPSSGSPNYGYEVWAAVPPEITPEDDLQVVMFPGGLYAVTSFTNLEHITEVWAALVRWREDSPYLPGDHQWLEHLLNPLEKDYTKFTFDLYLPITA